MLEIKNISKEFNGNVVLDDISLSVNSGDIISILGPSGCGKTTLLNIILGIEHQESGLLELEGEDIGKSKPIDRKFSIAFQNYALFPHLSANDNIMYGLKKNKDIDTEYVKEVIQLMELEEHLGKDISQLSGGQKQRVSLARALVVKPKLLLLDEPLSALDGVIKERIKRLIKNSAKKLGLTIIMVTHDPEEALTMSNKIVVLNSGKVEQIASPNEIIQNPKSEFVKNFITDLLQLKYQNIDKVLNYEK